MIIEQIRYHVTGEAAPPEVLEARRAVSTARVSLGLPAGHILVADPAPEDGPAIIWQCGYESETELAIAESAIAGSPEYGAARDRLGSLVERIEIELYASDEGVED